MATTAWEQYSAAQALARHEADLAGSIYHASYGVPDPAGAALRADLTAYLAQVIDVEWPAQVAGHAVPAAEPLLAHLQQTVLEVMPAGAGPSNVQSFLIGALSDVAAARRDRRLAAHGTIPDLVWIVLLSGGALMVGCQWPLNSGSPALPVLLAGRFGVG